MTKRLLRASLVLGVLILLLPSRGIADPITFSGVSPTVGRSASATFDLSPDGSTLLITLTNTGLAAPTTANDILTGIFFDMAGSPVLKPLNAVCPNYGQPGGCVITNGGTDAGSTLPGEVSGEWAFRNKADLAYSADYGISSVNLGGLFSNAAFNFPGDNIAGTIPVGGIEYGITTAADPCVDPTCGVGSQTNSILWQPEISDSVVFSLSGLAPGFDPSAAISNVTFNYGTGMTPLTEPPTFTLLGFGVLAVALSDRFRNRFLTQASKQA